MAWLYYTTSKNSESADQLKWGPKILTFSKHVGYSNRGGTTMQTFE